MSKTVRVVFALKGQINGVEITPHSIDLARFNEFHKQVEQFIVGSAKQIRAQEVHAEVEPGSHALATAIPLAAYAFLAADLERMQNPAALSKMDVARGEIVVKWQENARRDPTLRYRVESAAKGFRPIEIRSDTQFVITEDTQWVATEKYLVGEVLEMGGARQVNVHIRLKDDGQILKVDSTKGFLSEQTESRLYREVLVRVVGEQHLQSGKLRNARLVEFVDHKPTYDGQRLEKLMDQAARSWAGVSDPGGWLKELRGEVNET